MNRDRFKRRLAAVEARLRPTRGLRDLLTAEEESFLWKLAEDEPAGSGRTLQDVLAEDDRGMGATILAKLTTPPRQPCSYILCLCAHEVGL